MADLSKIKLNGTEYDIKDSFAREELDNKQIKNFVLKYKFINSYFLLLLAALEPGSSYDLPDENCENINEFFQALNINTFNLDQDLQTRIEIYDDNENLIGYLIFNLTILNIIPQPILIGSNNFQNKTYMLTLSPDNSGKLNGQIEVTSLENITIYSASVNNNNIISITGNTTSDIWNEISDDMDHMYIKHSAYGKYFLKLNIESEDIKLPLIGQGYDDINGNGYYAIFSGTRNDKIYTARIYQNNNFGKLVINETPSPAQIAYWNAKSNFSGNYNDLTNKPTIPEDKLFLINVTLDGLSGISDKSSTEIAAAVNAGKLPIVKTGMDQMSMMATLVNIEEMQEDEETYYAATFIYNDENESHISSPSFITKAVMIIIGTNVDLQIKTGSYITSYELEEKGYLTSYTETDPTVPAWAKQANKPTYTASEVGALPSTTNIPTKTSDLTNDSGYITSYTETDPIFTASAAANISSTDITNWNAKSDFSGSYEDLEDKPTIPEVSDWALAANKPTYTANEVGALPSTYTPPVTSVNGETGNVIISKIKTTASNNNVEYNLMGTTSNNNTTAISPYNQDLLSFAKTTDFSRLTIGSTATPGKVRLYSSADSASGYTELKSNASSTNAREVVFPDASGTVALTTDIPSVPSWALALSKPSYTFSELTSHPTTLNDYGITNAYTKTEVDGLVSGVLHYKGTKANVSALPSSGNVTGDVWHITADGSEWAWDGSDWQELGTAVDLSGYLQSGDIAAWAKAANKPTYTANEVGALSSNTNYVSSFNGQSGAITYVPPVSSVNGQTGVVELTIPSDTSDLTNGAGFLTSFTETDPTVPSWAKASTKPSYTASEVGAASATHTHGSITSDGAITENTALASSDRLVFADNSDSGKLKRSSITFGSSTTQYLANNGTWQNAYDDTALAARVSALEQIPWVTYYTGSSTPSNSQGNDGDLYFQTAQ